MDFFNSLTLDLKFLAVGIAGFALLALFSGNRSSERRYLVVLAVLAAAGVYRFKQVDHAAEASVAANAPVSIGKVQAKHVPLVSTSAK